MPTTSAVKTTTSITRDPNSLGPAVHPGEVLREEFLVPLEMPQTEAARQLGITTVRLNEIVREKRGVTADTALRLAAVFKTSPQFWMHMQANYELKQASASRTETRQSNEGGTGHAARTMSAGTQRKVHKMAAGRHK